ncbi:DUF4230 domain-containing protein [Candidatus Fermentibacterales bacterium]|nr:DUF4230 domain-containing protein [Candidatus Fermentibacterales bacterium]
MTAPTDPDREKLKSSSSELITWGLVLLVILLALKSGCISIDLTPGSDPRGKTSEQAPSVERMLEALRAQPRLVTAETTIEVALHRERTLERPLLPDGHVEAWLVVPAIVRAGIDLSGVQREDLTISPGRAVARLPVAEVTGVDIRYADLRWDSTADLGALFQGDREALGIREDLIEEARSRLPEEAMRAGLLGRAEARARDLVTGVLIAMGCHEVHVFFGNEGTQTQARG